VNVIEISFGLSLSTKAKNTTEQAIKTNIRIDINSPLFSQKKKGTLFFSLASLSLLLPCRERSEAIAQLERLAGASLCIEHALGV
jgi:hypothetical protein